MFYFELVSSVVQVNYYVAMYLPLINQLLKYSLPVKKNICMSIMERRWT